MCAGLLPEDTMRKFQWMEETEKEMVSKANNPMEFLMMSQAETIRCPTSITWSMANEIWSHCKPTHHNGYDGNIFVDGSCPRFICLQSDERGGCTNTGS